MDKEKFKINLPEIILIGLMCAMNVIFDLVVSPPLKTLLGHIIAGIFIMVPINFIFITFTKLMVDKYETITIYLTIFGILSIPTAMFGGVAGVYKIVVGFMIGFFLDLALSFDKKSIKIIFGSIIGSIFWWMLLFIIWQAFQLPFVTAFSNLFNSTIDISGIVTIPIIGFGGPFFLFAIICGFISAIPCILGSLIGYYLFISIKKTAIYEKFINMQ